MRKLRGGNNEFVEIGFGEMMEDLGFNGKNIDEKKGRIEVNISEEYFR